MHVHSIPGKLEISYDPSSKTVVDTWSSYFITLDEFKDAIADKALSAARLHGARAWVADASNAKGSFRPEIQDFIAKTLFPAFVKAGIKYFISIAPASAVTGLTVANYKAKVGPAGLKLVELPSVAEALKWVRAN